LLFIEQGKGKKDRTVPVGTVYAVVFSQTVTGAVALHRFARLISDAYGRQAKLQITENLFAGNNSAVGDILKNIMISEPVSR
jgi:hypothetical protein